MKDLMMWSPTQLILVEEIQLGAGMGKKAADYFTLPVCFSCHTGCHDGTFDKETQMRWCLETIYKALKEEVLIHDK